VKNVDVEKIRVSIGSASVLGLGSAPKFKDPPTTCYVMTYTEKNCTANCGFCSQARTSNSSESFLSRVSWPTFPFKDFLTKLKYLHFSKKFKRICIQTLNYSENFRDLTEIIINIRKNTDIPISVAIPPLPKEELRELKIIGVERVGIALDGASPEIFNKIKGIDVDGPYRWDQHLQKLEEALEIFSPGFVSTHLIIGLGESEKDVIERIDTLHNSKILISLFAFTPIKGTKFENLNQPSILRFRKIQLGRFLIVSNMKDRKDITYNSKGDIIRFNMSKQELKNVIDNTEAFLTSGCLGCNRPYYTSKPSGPIYNYPRELIESEKKEIYNLLLGLVN
jgi:biotin synthase